MGLGLVDKLGRSVRDVSVSDSYGAADDEDDRVARRVASRIDSHGRRYSGKEGEGRLTPTFISIVPQSTNIVEFPFLAMVIIWTILMIEHTVVKRPSVKMPIRPIFRRKLIWTFIRSGIGIRKMTTSQKMVIAAST